MREIRVTCKSRNAAVMMGFWNLHDIIGVLANRHCKLRIMDIVFF